MVKTTASKATDGLEGDHSATLPELLNQSLDAGLILLTSDLKISTVSDTARRILNLGDGVVAFTDLPKSLQTLFREGHGGAESCAAVQVFSPDSKARTVKVTMTPVPGKTGRPDGIAAVLQDTESVLQLERNLRQLDRLASIGTLSASMAHEVKNALVAIQTFVDLLIAQNQNSQLADLVGRELKRINSIVSQMLRFGGPARPKLAIIHVHEALEQSITLVQHHLEGRRIQLGLDLHAAPDTVRGGAYQLEQAFLNLIFNALDAMGASGTLQVTTRVVGLERAMAPGPQAIEISIKDTGTGISPENLKRLFAPFFTTKPNGTGLGLPITRRIIEEHHGTISVSSELHQGTQFTIRLPLVTKHQP